MSTASLFSRFKSMVMLLLGRGLRGWRRLQEGRPAAASRPTSRGRPLRGGRLAPARRPRAAASWRAPNRQLRRGRRLPVPVRRRRATAAWRAARAAVDGCMEGGGQRLRGGLEGGGRAAASVEDSRVAGRRLRGGLEGGGRPAASCVLLGTVPP
jgi:hypothetical protein